ncbi:hypothetical protein SK128_001939 [Halocaridina rubra]|uniref:Uncharacterized protein n=1 Tax=Halocaridina rubra TaxID=373956 RepID=A0AAN9FU57_HALRR
MAFWTSLAVLSALAVSTLSLPGPDGAYNIPRVGTGRRSQYFVLHSDGTYKYGHDTGEGAFESARLNSPGDLEGEFGYRDPDGNNINLQYKSGESGFVASGQHLPSPHPDFDAAHEAARERAPFVDPLADSSSDSSYKFQFAGEEQSRTEESDSDGTVRGSYTYTDEDGITRTYTYTAGRDTGFVIEGTDLPQGPVESGLTPAATRFSSSANRVSSSRNSSPSRTVGSSVSSQRRPVSPSSRPSSRLPSRSSGATTRSGVSGSASSHRNSVNSDGSYSFAYNAGDHSRTESADANLNVEGEFSFVADDGVQRRVSYESGANRGFHARGDHIPTPPDAGFGNRIQIANRQPTHRASSPSRPSPARLSPPALKTPSVHSHSTFQSSRPQSTFQAPRLHSSAQSPRPQSALSSSHHQSTFSAHRQQSVFPTPTTRKTTGSLSLPSPSSPRVPFEEANTRSEFRPDGSYAFAYETSSHSRAESGDSDNNVDGEFSFVADDDGQRREIKYEAGSDTGFIAEGTHIPIGPEVPGAPSGQPTGRIVPVQEVPFVDPLADTGLDASYNFDFDSEQYSRTETADSEGNVQGTYTVVDDDGTRRTYRFRAGKGVGFETEEVSVSRGAPPTRQAASTSGSASLFSGTNTQVSSPSFRGAASPSSSSTPFRQSGSFSSTSAHGSGIQTAPQFSTSSSTINRGGSGLRTSSYTAPSSSFNQGSTTSSFSSSSRTPLRSSFIPDSTKEVFPGFQLHQYDASKNPDKFGYVLTFDN